MHDRIGGFRGLGLKLLDVPGEKMLPYPPNAMTQDFLFINHPSFPARDLSTFLPQAKLLDGVVSNLPHVVQEAQGGLIRAGAEVGRLFGVDPAVSAVGLGKHETSILGDTFWTSAPVRYGDYIAKISVSPVSESLMPYVDKAIDTSDENAVRNEVMDFFATQAAEYEIRVQLCTDLEEMPVENLALRWPEDKSPYVSVGKITLPRQNAYSPARASYGNDVLSFSPWHCLAAHQPLGSIMRARKPIYEASSEYRHEKNRSPRVEPASISDVPE